MKNIWIALENIRSLHNVGAIFRTCSFFDTPNVLLVGYTGKTFNHRDEVILHPNIAKSSLGYEKDLNISLIDTTKDLINFAHNNNLKLISIEQHEKSTQLSDWIPQENEILIFGNEVTGVSEELLSKSDKIIEISRYGKQGSLNVTTTCGIILNHLQTRLTTN